MFSKDSFIPFIPFFCCKELVVVFFFVILKIKIQGGNQSELRLLVPN